jgi:DNA polymerase-3 subunit alpha
MLSDGDSIGVFQIESSGMRSMLRQMQADKLEDIIALISLYRPGPMENIPTYINRKLGRETVTYPHPLLENTLKETHGVIVYQEQVMEIARVLAGYSLGSADILRRAMGKKIQSEMDIQRKIFVDGAIKNGVEKNQAGEIFDLVDKFAGYGFNKSHAAAYALISYQTAYLKANFPVEFLTASINLEIDNSDKINIFLQVAKDHDIQILPPDINSSSALFEVEKIG